MTDLIREPIAEEPSDAERVARDNEIASREEEKVLLEDRLTYLQQSVRDTREHPEIVSRLEQVRTHLPRVSRTAPKGLTSMYDHLRGIEQRLTERPDEVLAEEITRTETRLAAVEEDLTRLEVERDGDSGSLTR